MDIKHPRPLIELIRGIFGLAPGSWLRLIWVHTYSHLSITRRKEVWSKFGTIKQIAYVCENELPCRWVATRSTIDHETNSRRPKAVAYRLRYVMKTLKRLINQRCQTYIPPIWISWSCFSLWFSRFICHRPLLLSFLLSSQYFAFATQISTSRVEHPNSRPCWPSVRRLDLRRKHSKQSSGVFLEVQNQQAAMWDPLLKSG